MGIDMFNRNSSVCFNEMFEHIDEQASKLKKSIYNKAKWQPKLGKAIANIIWNPVKQQQKLIQHVSHLQSMTQSGHFDKSKTEHTDKYKKIFDNLKAVCDVYKNIHGLEEITTVKTKMDQLETFHESLVQPTKPEKIPDERISASGESAKSSGSLEISDLETKAQAGDPEAMRLFGESKRSEDPKVAAEWFRKAASQGDSEAMLKLAECYRKGEGVVRNVGKAKEWYTKAADHGNAEGMRELALHYMRGGDWVEHHRSAPYLLTKAAALGNVEAIRDLGAYYRSQIHNQHEARPLFQEAKDRGSIRAIYDLASMAQDSFHFSALMTAGMKAEKSAGQVPLSHLKDPDIAYSIVKGYIRFSAIQPSDKDNLIAQSKLNAILDGSNDRGECAFLLLRELAAGRLKQDKLMEWVPLAEALGSDKASDHFLLAQTYVAQNNLPQAYRYLASSHRAFELFKKVGKRAKYQAFQERNAKDGTPLLAKFTTAFVSHIDKLLGGQVDPEFRKKLEQLKDDFKKKNNLP